RRVAPGSAPPRDLSGPRGWGGPAPVPPPGRGRSKRCAREHPLGAQAALSARAGDRRASLPTAADPDGRGAGPFELAPPAAARLRAVRRYKLPRGPACAADVSGAPPARRAAVAPDPAGGRPRRLRACVPLLAVVPPSLRALARRLPRPRVPPRQPGGVIRRPPGASA